MRHIRKWFWTECYKIALGKGPEYKITARYFRIKANTSA